MSLIKPEQINQKLCNNIEGALRYLYKDVGVIKAGKFYIGNIQGDPGESLFVYLKDGRFKDASTGDYGDILELFSLHFGSKSEGIKRACDFLGIKTNIRKGRKKTPYTRPVKDWTELEGEPLKYLTEERRLSVEVLEEAKVRMRGEDIVFLYFTHSDKSLETCGALYVTPPKEDSKKKLSRSKNALMVLWGHKEVPIPTKGKGELIITEGQIDCLSLRTAGIKNCVSVPSGVSDLTWIENSWEFLDQFSCINILFDNDEPGQSGAEKVAKRIGMERCKYINLPPHINDVNQALLENLSLPEIVQDSKEFKPSNLINSSDLWDIAIDGLKSGRPQDQGIPFMGWEEEESIRFRIRPKEWTIYTGKPGNGKSALLYQLAAYLIFKQNQRVFIASLEEDPAQIMGYISVKAMAEEMNEENEYLFREIRKLIDKRLWVYNHRGRASMKDLVYNAEYTVRKYGVQHVIIDSVAKTDLNIEDNEQANEFVNRVSTSVDDTGCHYHLVAHPKKNTDHYPSDTDDIKGAASFGIEAFNLISIERSLSKQGAIRAADKFGVDQEGKVKGRNYTKEDVESWGDSKLRITKQKVGGEIGHFDLFFNTNSLRFRRIQEQNDHPYVDIEELKRLSQTPF